ncbi:MAG: ABC transporter ATP-binding protein [Candidatus Limivivens sp.]|nr:ABC transporter ATP-binding protein [Candidatus Limivivens sp.]
MKENVVLSVRNLKTYFKQDGYTTRAVDGISFDIPRGKTLCLVGESGCGKSLTAMSILGLVPYPGEVVEGKILFHDTDLTKVKKKNMSNYRGKSIGMIFQEPMTSLNPVLRIGRQLSEVYRVHEKMGKKEAKEHAIEMLRMVKIPEPEQRYRDYPHQLSGGMRQRVMIAMALACKPDILICDEPTTALDVTVQAQIMKLIVELQNQMGMSVLLITHDMGIVSEMADQIHVIYAGKIVEKCDRERLFVKQYHPYSEALIRSIPVIGQRDRELYSIPGMVPRLTEERKGCLFAERCPYAMDRCRKETPELTEVEPGREVACYRYESK